MTGNHTDIYHDTYGSPLGTLLLASDGKHLTGLRFGTDTQEHDSLEVFRQTRQWLDAYFAGQQPDFTPPLLLSGSLFAQSVYRRLLTVPYGETATYGQLARLLADERQQRRVSAQAVGGALKRNPIAIIVPCHRIVGADGALTGYAYGLEHKAALIRLERSHVRRQVRKDGLSDLDDIIHLASGAERLAYQWMAETAIATN